MPTTSKPKTPAKSTAKAATKIAPARKPSSITLPPNAKNLPAAAQSAYKKGAASATGGAAAMTKAGWAAVKAAFERDDASGKWKAKKAKAATKKA